MRRFITAWLLALIIILAAATTDTYTSLRHDAIHFDTDPILTPRHLLPQPSSSPLNFMNVISRAKQKAISGGLSGLIAGAVQVVTLMWLRTTVNYQYRYGVSMTTAIRELYRQGGIPRFYRGLPYALVQGPLARFGGVAANDAAIVFAAYLTGKSEILSKGVLSTALGSVLAGEDTVLPVSKHECLSFGRSRQKNYPFDL